jgi:hypothetical protein
MEPEGHYRVLQSNLPLSQFNPVETLTSYFFNIHSNIIIPFPLSPKIRKTKPLSKDRAINV